MILGHKKQISLLKKFFKTGKIPHALLFSGQSKIGKKLVAFEFASLIFGKPPHSHSDFVFLEPKNEIISIGQIRELSFWLSFKPFVSRFKVAILDEAQKMTLEAQNCFLKTLEEPKGNSIIILISSLPEILLPTIRSRCQEIKFFPLKRQEMESFLKSQGLESEKINEILKIARGRPGIVFEILKNFEQIDKIRKKVENFSRMSILERFEFLKKVNQDLFLEIFLNYWREKLFESKKAILILKYIFQFQFLENIGKVDKKMALEILALKV